MRKISVCWLLVLSASAAYSASPTQTDALAALRAKHAAVAARLQSSPFKQPVVLDSVQTADHTQGDVYAVLAHPLATLRRELTSPSHWCDVMSLHANTKYCQAGAGSAGSVLKVYIGQKIPQSLDAASEVNLNFSVVDQNPQYLQVVLHSNEGPMGTSDYKIAFQAMALSANTTFVQFSYAYASGVLARVAMQTYLATSGASKVGFTVTGRRPDGQPVHVAGVLGLVERNTMRFYLAIDSFLASTAQPASQQLEHRLQNWFTAVERYPLQLHEMQRQDYLAMKRAEDERQKAPATLIALPNTR
jgi:hypothetical protein